jgi:endonuclease-8
VPEGDTIWKTAATLRRALAGRELVGFEARVPLRRRPSLGASVRDAEARGKHLLVRFGDDTVLHTHMGMHGTWHVYRAGDTWRRHRAAMRVALATAETQAVCFSAPVVELLTARELEADPRLTRLGPDLAAPEPDLDAAAERLAGLRGVEIGTALLDQRVAAGIGNVYKSEVLFACRVDPFAPVNSLDDAIRAHLLSTASRLLRANAERGGPRATTSSGRLAVYGRAGLGCPRCGERIVSARRGEHARVTYWCPRCQPATASTTAAT